MSVRKPVVFLGYPSKPPLLRETLSKATQYLTATDLVQGQSWESLRVAGRLIITEITKAIDSCDLACFDMTGLNPNVLFELGYAIGAEKRIWLLIDDSDVPTMQQWDKIKVLTTVGYSPYANAEAIRAEFLSEQPHLQDRTIFDTAISESLIPDPFASVFFVKSPHETEAERMILRELEKTQSIGFRLIVADHSESVYALSWYAQQIYASAAVVIHLTSPRRAEASIHNARCGLIAGLAHGMRKPLLMLAEEDFETPIDYQELLFKYQTARACSQHVATWLEGTLEPVAQEIRQTGARRGLRLATELKSLRLGEDVAENEAEELEAYFVETAGYLRVLEKRSTTLFVGRRGTGKTANLLRASAVLRKDRRNLVCVVKPPGYEVSGVVRLMTKLIERDTRGYAVEALWLYLLYTEIALAAVERAERRAAGIQYGTAEWRLREFCENPANGIREDFAVRLDRAVSKLNDTSLPNDLLGVRSSIASIVHGSLIDELKPILAAALADTASVVALIDNLDKAWEKAADVEQLSFLITGLLQAVERMSSQFTKGPDGAERAPLSIAVFLRSDIFTHLTKAFREPDKLPVARLVWEDPDVLLRVVEERYVAGRGGEAQPEELWDRFFPKSCRGQPIRAYIQNRVLPRPRDIVHFCNDAIAAAVNSRHDRITEEDLMKAERSYSQFALEALRVENGMTVAELESVLFEFVGVNSIMDESSVRKTVGEVVEGHRVEGMLGHLKAFSFLGVEVKNDEFRYADEPEEVRKVEALADRLSKETGRRRLAIHPAFRSYLEVKE